MHIHYIYVFNKVGANSKRDQNIARIKIIGNWYAFKPQN